jgi:hypothetical protein
MSKAKARPQSVHGVDGAIPRPARRQLATGRGLTYLVGVGMEPTRENHAIGLLKP